jgi:hypothetical protein
LASLSIDHAVPSDEWAASSSATIEIIQFFCETPGGLTKFLLNTTRPKDFDYPMTIAVIDQRNEATRDHHQGVWRKDVALRSFL